MLETSYLAMQHIWLGLSFLILAIFVLDQMNIFRSAMLDADDSYRGKLFLVVLFSLIGVGGFYWGFQINGAIINVKAVGVIVSGLLGGPVAGSVTGLIVGSYRSVFIDTYSVIESGGTTILMGAAAGFLSYYVKSKKRMWPYALAIAFFLETVYMLLLLVFIEPFDKAVVLVSQIAPSMICANTLGVGIIIRILEDIYTREEKIEGTATKTALYVASLTMSALSNGLDEESASETVNTIIGAVDNFDCVALLSNKKILALAAKDKEKKDRLAEYLSAAMAKSFLGRDSTIFLTQEGWLERFIKATGAGTIRTFYPIKSRVVVPIYDGNAQVGYLFLGSTVRVALSNFEQELATGLGKLISAQIETGKVKEQAKLLANAEIKALQSQINPHFLFNALNTISFYCRKQPETAKRLLTDLADYYRRNLSDTNIFIPLQQELQHINAYTSIELARFGDRLAIQYDIGQDCAFKVPGLILQPLVENAIKHGIFPKAEGGSVRIRVIPCGRYYELSVEDDGVGMSAEQLKNIFFSKKGGERASIGLGNVHKRLLSIYGPDNGLTIQSEENKGTIVSFRIPLEEVIIHGVTDIDS